MCLYFQKVIKICVKCEAQRFRKRYLLLGKHILLLFFLFFKNVSNINAHFRVVFEFRYMERIVSSIFGVKQITY